MITPKAMRDAFIEKIWQAMCRDRRLFFLSADFGSPVLDKIRADFPDRFVNVGVAEQNLINIATGLALEGYIVFAYAIAPFISMRCYEQIRVNLALLSQVRPMNVNLIGVGAGYSYAMSGPTHQCFEDLTLMRALPNVELMSPADHVTAAACFERCVNMTGPKYCRFDAEIMPVIYEQGPPQMGQGFHVHRSSGRVCLVGTGYMTHTALKVSDVLAEDGDEVAVIDLFDLTRFKHAELYEALKLCTDIVTIEEGFSGRGGLDSLLREYITKNNLAGRVHAVGINSIYDFSLGSRDILHQQAGIGVEAILKKVRNLIRSTTEAVHTME